MRYQSNGMEFTYQEALYLKKELLQDISKMSAEVVARLLRKDIKFLKEYDAEILPMVILAMDDKEYEDFQEYVSHLRKTNKIYITQPYKSKNSNLITVVPCHD